MFYSNINIFSPLLRSIHLPLQSLSTRRNSILLRCWKMPLLSLHWQCKHWGGGGGRILILSCFAKHEPRTSCNLFTRCCRTCTGIGALERHSSLVWREHWLWWSLGCSVCYLRNRRMRKQRFKYMFASASIYSKRWNGLCHIAQCVSFARKHLNF